MKRATRFGLPTLHETAHADGQLGQREVAHELQRFWAEYRAGKRPKITSRHSDKVY
jgi:hypothetical protein